MPRSEIPTRLPAAPAHTAPAGARPHRVTGRVRLGPPRPLRPAFALALLLSSAAVAAEEGLQGPDGEAGWTTRHTLETGVDFRIPGLIAAVVSTPLPGLADAYPDPLPGLCAGQPLRIGARVATQHGTPVGSGALADGSTGLNRRLGLALTSALIGAALWRRSA